MSPAHVLSSVGLIKTSRRRGFCPACRLFQTDDGPQEIAAPALVAFTFLIVAALAWVFTIERMSSMDDTTMDDMAMGEMAMDEMAMGLGSFGSFVATWAVMMAAMMLPSAMPLVFEFARNSERRRGWRTATALLGATYLGMWLAFGVVCYILYNAVGMPWSNQGLIGGAALVIAGLYALTPVKRESEALCRERCALHGPLPFNLMRSAVVAGTRYGLSCLGCSAGLMVAMVLIGMANLGWMIVLAAVVLVYKLAPAPMPRATAALSSALVALGVLYAVAG
jgi:predicted metal-binding membrane protein